MIGSNRVRKKENPVGGLFDDHLIYTEEGVCCVVAAALWAGIYTLTTGAVGDRRHVFL